MITLPGKPLSTNQVYKVACGGNHPRLYMSKEGKARKEEYQWELKRQWKKQPLEGELIINVILYFDDHRTHDWDNYNKLLSDSCNGIVWKDDSQVIEAHVFKEYDKENPRIELIIIHEL